MKRFIYQVESFEFTDTEAFGTAWKEAKEKAKELHAPIYRTVVETQRQVFCTAGCFLGVDYARNSDIEIF